MDCNFCWLLRLRYLENLKPAAKASGLHDEFSVAMVTESYDERHRFRGQLVSHGYKLRFCPECGANIKKRLRKWRAENAQ